MAVYLCTYRAVKERLVQVPLFGDANVTYVVAGTCAEVVSSCLWTPLEVLKSRLQIAHSDQLAASTSTSTVRQIRAIFAGEGVRGFYRGYGLGLAVFIPYNALWWSAYENAKHEARTRYGVTDVSRQAAFASFLATAFSTCVAHPLDLIKTRYQVSTSESVSDIVARESRQMPVDRSITRDKAVDGRPVRASARGSGSDALMQHESRSSERLGVRYVWRNVVRESGYRGLYAGLGPRLMCSVPGSVISMAVFEYFKPDGQQRPARQVDGVGAPDIVVMDEVSG